MRYKTYWGPEAGNRFRQNSSAAPPSAHSASEPGSGVAATTGPVTFPVPVVPSNSVTPKVVGLGATVLSKINPDSGVPVNIPLFSINDTNSSGPPGVLTVSVTAVKALLGVLTPPGAAKSVMVIPGVMAISRTANNPVPSAATV